MSSPLRSGTDDQGGLGWLDMTQCALFVHIDRNGVSTTQAGPGISPAQAALWLRHIADHFDPPADVASHTTGAGQ